MYVVRWLPVHFTMTNIYVLTTGVSSQQSFQRDLRPRPCAWTQEHLCQGLWCQATTSPDPTFFPHVHSRSREPLTRGGLFRRYPPTPRGYLRVCWQTKSQTKAKKINHPLTSKASLSSLCELMEFCVSIAFFFFFFFCFFCLSTCIPVVLLCVSLSLFMCMLLYTWHCAFVEVNVLLVYYSNYGVEGKWQKRLIQNHNNRVKGTIFILYQFFCV